MTKKEFYFPSADRKTKVHAVQWLPEEEPIGILQIAHGVTEHILRYEELAQYFTQKGFVVVGNDHLGHGTSIAEDAQPMYFGPDGSWEFVVKDVFTCSEQMKKSYPNIPHILMGLSLGSFVVRTCIIQRPDMVDGVILAGTGQNKEIELALAKMVAKMEAKKVGEEYPSPQVDKLTFDTYNKKFAPNRTDYDWLCASEKGLNEYIADPLRGKAFSTGLFRDMLSGMQFTGKLKNQKKMNHDMPVLLVSGDKDPVGDFVKGVKRTYSSFAKAGMKDITMKLYPELRHDIFREDCRKEVFEYLHQWIESKFLMKNNMIEK